MNGSKVFYFIDGNYPGVVYRGTQGHFEGLGREGGYPIRLKNNHKISRGRMKIQREWWPIQDAPAHWASPQHEGNS